jgi:hypothetical protein
MPNVEVLQRRAARLLQNDKKGGGALATELQEERVALHFFPELPL